MKSQSYKFKLQLIKNIAWGWFFGGIDLMLTEISQKQTINFNLFIMWRWFYKSFDGNELIYSRHWPFASREFIFDMNYSEKVEIPKNTSTGLSIWTCDCCFDGYDKIYENFRGIINHDNTSSTHRKLADRLDDSGCSLFIEKYSLSLDSEFNKFSIEVNGWKIVCVTLIKKIKFVRKYIFN